MKHVSDMPDLIREWDFERNSALGLEPYKWVKGSDTSAYVLLYMLDGGNENSWYG